MQLRVNTGFCENRVSQISNTYFDFGRAPQKGGIADPVVASETEVLQSTSPGGGF